MVGGLVEDQEVCLGEHQFGQGYTASFAAGEGGDQLEYIVIFEQEGSQYIADASIVQCRVGI